MISLENYWMFVLRNFLKSKSELIPVIQSGNFEFPTVLWLVYNIDELSSYFFDVHKIGKLYTSINKGL